MKIPLLIIGYERSGTTLIRRLISMHPDLPASIVHEKGKILLRAQTKDEAEKKLILDETSIRVGQKVPYVVFERAVAYVQKYREFYPESWILHIIRSPVYAINSQVRKFQKNPDKCIVKYFSSVPQFHQFLLKEKRTKTIFYEDLISRPAKNLRKIYDWISPGVSDEHIQKAISTKQPWQCGERIMPGLRFFDKVANTSPTMHLNRRQIKQIRALEQRYGDIIRWRTL